MRLWRFLKLQAVLWHSDYYTDWDRLRMRFDPHYKSDQLESDPPKNPPVIPETPR